MPEISPDSDPAKRAQKMKASMNCAGCALAMLVVICAGVGVSAAIGRATSTAGVLSVPTPTEGIAAVRSTVVRTTVSATPVVASAVGGAAGPTLPEGPTSLPTTQPAPRYTLVPIVTNTPIPTPTSTPTPQATATSTPTATPVPTDTPTPAPQPTATQTPTAMPTS